MKHTRFAALVDEHGQPLWRLTAAYARGEADREDLYQEILTAIWESLPHFRGDASVRTYLFRIAHNRGLTWRARHARRMAVEADPVDDAPDPASDPIVDIDRAIEGERLAAAVRALPPTLSQPVTLVLEGLSHAEIATVLGITEGNVAVRMSRARAALARLLGAGAGR